jgi:hypothetical protein
MARTARQILKELSLQTSIHVRSTADLVEHTGKAAAAIDAQRREKGQETGQALPPTPLGRIWGVRAALGSAWGESTT